MFIALLLRKWDHYHNIDNQHWFSKSSDSIRAGKLLFIGNYTTKEETEAATGDVL